MENLSNPLYDIRFRDVEVLLELVKTRSVRELARRFNTTPGNISKTIKGLEHRLGVTLLNRSMRGIEATPEADKLFGYLEGIQDLQQKMEGALKKERKESLLSFASTSFVTTHLLPAVLSEFQNEDQSFRFRIVDLPPNQFVPAGLRNGFQICIHIGEIDWPRTWNSTRVGTVNWDLYASMDHPLPKRPTIEKVLKYPFVYPVYWSNEGIRFGDDSCPLSIRKRIRGHETATATAAVEVVRQTDQLAFLPNLVTSHWIAAKTIRKIKVPSWKSVNRPLFLTVKGDFIKQSVYKRLQRVLSEHLEKI